MSIASFKMNSVLAYMDDATALAVLNAMWDDLDTVAAETEGNERTERQPNIAGGFEMTDANRSLEVQKLELRSHFISRLDRLLAREWARNETGQDEDEAGAKILKEIADEIKAKSSSGRKLAERLFEVDIDVSAPSSSTTDTSEVASDAKFLSAFRDWAKEHANEKDNGNEQSVTSDNDSKGHEKGPSKAECVCCMADFTSQETVTRPCSHSYCYDCLGDFFRRTITDESAFPPKCCNEPIPIDDEEVKAALDEDLIVGYRDRAEELETPDKIYCSNQECSAWIAPRHLELENEVAKCPKCQASTCTVCKSAAHEGTDCPEDEGTKIILDLAKQEEWSQCYLCHRIVELLHGCWHISKHLRTHPSNVGKLYLLTTSLQFSTLAACFCGAEFCYRCRKPWKTCKPDCEAWEDGDDDWTEDEAPEFEPEADVEVEVEVVENNEPRRLPPPGEVIQLNGVQDVEVQGAEVQDIGIEDADVTDAVFRAIQSIRDGSIDNECNHNGRWLRVEGRHRCENCDYRLHHFAERCLRCHSLLCRRCRLDRTRN